jgi:AcrR family transcriptional regulator
MSATSWLAPERDALATDRILDAAGVVFTRDGVTGAAMADIAIAAGCSRATLYRYFDDRHALRVAFVHREARRLGAEVATAVASTRDPSRRLVAAIVRAVEGVRTTPTLAAWFTDASAGTATELAGASEVIEAMAAAFVGADGTPVDDDTRERARWVVRIVVSLLTMPGPSMAAERRLVERFVVPVVVS